jgi:hypothetical protein
VIELTLQRLAELGFNLVPLDEIRTHYIFERDGFVALVERKEDNAFGSAGSPGLITENGFAALVWRGEQAWFVARGFEQPATEEQVAALRKFSRDLDDALHT